jgi:DNA (cytosine-5)-methyltransferase 1
VNPDSPPIPSPYRRLSHLDLFSGIGGFALAASWTGAIRTAGFCEIDPFCQSVLQRHWPAIPIFNDIHDITTTLLDSAGIHSVDLVTGGFPCQPFSVAGKRRGAADHRHLWPEMRRVIAELRPTWVLAENVAHFVNLGLDQCLADLEAEGYDAGALVVPACAVGARHRRERVWVVAHRNRTGRRSSSPGPLPGQTGQVSDSRPGRLRPGERQEGADDAPAGDTALADADLPRLQGHGRPEEYAGEWPAWPGRRPLESLWQSEPAVGRVAHGVPRRVDRLRSLGNAVVPQVAYRLLSAIVQMEANGRYIGQ